MRSFGLRLAGVFVAVILSTGWLLGQSATGVPPFGSFSSGPFDTINNANLDAHFAIPVIVRPGVGLNFNFLLTYDSLIWNTTSPGGLKEWWPDARWGWTKEGAVGHLTYSSSSVQCGNQYQFQATYFNWSYSDAGGTAGGACLVPCHGCDQGPHVAIAGRSTHSDRFIDGPHTSGSMCAPPAGCLSILSSMTAPRSSDYPKLATPSLQATARRRKRSVYVPRTYRFPNLNGVTQ